MGKQLTKKELLAARKQAYKIWSKSNKTARFFRIAKQSGLTQEQVKYYIEADKWHERYEKAVRSGKIEGTIDDQPVDMVYKATDEETNQLQNIINRSGLNEKHKMFIMFYLQSYNAKLAAIKAGYPPRSAAVKGSTLLKDPTIDETVKQIKELMFENIYIGSHDIVNKYVKIAFADITDFVKFGAAGVTLKESHEVDGTLITEVKQGRDGVTLKMADKIKALERLDKIFEIIPDRQLELNKDKFEFTKEITEGHGDGVPDVTIINDIG